MLMLYITKSLLNTHTWSYETLDKIILMDSSSSVKIISSCFIKPKTIPEESRQPYYLSPFDLMSLSRHYIQHGLLFLKPSNVTMETLLQNLRDSLATTLVYFYPLAGRLSTSKTDNPRFYSVFVDSNNSPGAGFIYAKSDLSVEDIVGSKYVPLVVHSFFDHHKALNYDGQNLSLLSVNVTELVDGVFIGLSMNHMLGDGCSFWHFFKSWSEMFQAQQTRNKNSCLTNPPVLSRWFPEGNGPVLNLPFSHHDEFIRRFENPVLKERIFHFSSETIRSLKSKANQECRITTTTTTISSLQSLIAMIWRYITRARKLPYEQETCCSLAADNRSRMDPPLPSNYFGRCVSILKTTAKSGELLENGLGFAALKVHQAVIGHTSENISQMIEKWLKSPFVLDANPHMEPVSIALGSSPRFEKYGIEFGMGKAVTVRSGYGSKFDGKIWAYPGREGGGSIDLEVCLVPECMEALESDKEFMSFVS